YADHYTLNDNAYGTIWGPSTPGAIDLASGNTNGVILADAINKAATNGDIIPDGTGNSTTGYTLVNDANAYWDDCATADAVAFSGQNVGNLLNNNPPPNGAPLSWGWFSV